MKIRNLTKKAWPIFIGLFILGLGQSANAQEMTINKKNGTANFIEFKKDQEPTPQRAMEVLSEKLEFTTQDELRFVKKGTDNLGFSHQRFQQFYKGLKVQDAIYKVHSKNNKVTVMNGQFMKLDQLNINPSLSEATALDAAVSFVGATEYMWEGDGLDADIPTGELVIVENFYTTDRDKINKAVLAWKFNIYASAPLSRDFVYVDANTGEIVYSDAIIKNCFAGHDHNEEATCGTDHHNCSSENKLSEVEEIVAQGTGATRYSGAKNFEATPNANGGYSLLDQTRGQGINTRNVNNQRNLSNVTPFIDNDNNWTASEYDNVAKDNAALDVHWGTQRVYDYWLNAHNRDSYDGNGSVLNSYVHHGVKFNNAFWDGSQMRYGDGDDVTRDAYTSLDLVAHEIAHAVCQATADLAYQRESGALNEAFSDIWGAVIEYSVDPTKDTWAMFEEIDLRPAPKGSRNMSDPNQKGHPDTYGGNFWVAPNCGYPTGGNDRCGVHINSGVLNHWFYLLSVGGSGTNDNGDSYDVTGISIEQAAQIAYRLETVYLSVHSNYDDARLFGIIAARDIFGEGSLEEIATTNAFYAVGLSAQYGEAASYCQSSSKNADSEWIGVAELGGKIINSPTASGFTYQDFTESAGFDLNVYAGDINNVRLVPGFADNAYHEYWTVWIDFNSDGDFEDEGETVFSSDGSNSEVSGLLDISADVPSSETRLRVSMKYGSSPSPCEEFAYGEVQDYKVIIQSAITSDCPEIEEPTILNVKQNEFTIIWQTDELHDRSILRYRQVGQTDYVFQLVNGVDAFITPEGYTDGLILRNLVAGASYEVDVLATCLGSETKFTPTQIVNLLSPTDCSGGITSFPYTEGFENGNPWFLQDLPLTWELNSGATPNPGTGPSAASEGNNYVYVDSSDPNDSEKAASMVSPCLDLRNETSAFLTFDYHMYGGEGLGVIRLQGTVDNGLNWFTEWDEIGNQGNQWNTVTVDVSPYTGRTARFRLIGVNGTTTQGDLAIDNITLSTVLPPVCLNLELTLDYFPSETSWTLNDSDGNTIESGGDYDYNQANTTLNIELCVTPGCYDFTINDSFGDGICCYTGNGSYTLTDDNGAVVASGGSFEDFETTNLCPDAIDGGETGNSFAAENNNISGDLGNLGVSTETLDSELILYPNPTIDELNIKYTSNINGPATASVYDVFGRTILSKKLNLLKGTNVYPLNVSDLHQGNYLLQVNNGKRSETKLFIIVK